MDGCTITLTNGLVCRVDPEDYAWASALRWHGDRYAFRQVNRKTSYMHREIAKPPRGMVVDHINGDPLDNRRANLRVCTQGQNLRNMRARSGRWTSKYRGVCRDERGRWRAELAVNGVRHRRYSNASELDAAATYDALAIQHYGRFARLNRDMFPEDFR